MLIFLFLFFFNTFFGLVLIEFLSGRRSVGLPARQGSRGRVFVSHGDLGSDVLQMNLSLTTCSSR